MAVLLAKTGLDDADKWGSVISAFAGLLSLGLAGYGVVREHRTAQSASQPLTASEHRPGTARSVSGSDSAGSHSASGNAPRSGPASAEATLVKMVSSSGDRSIGVGGEMGGISSTGDQAINVQYNTFIETRQSQRRWLWPTVLLALPALVLATIFIAPRLATLGNVPVTTTPKNLPTISTPEHVPAITTPKKDPIFLTAIANRAIWTSGRGKIEFGGQPGTPNGHVVPDVETLEDGSKAGGFLTHPNWDDDGYLRGCFKLPRQLREDDWFIATGGFQDKYTAAGNVRFQVLVRDQQGNEKKIVDKVDDRANGRLISLDAPLGPYAGSKTICLQVTANGHAAQDAAFWVKPLIEPRSP
ncbi:hypothetical protein ABGB08_04540 [Acrocarpospora sp. B8E8]